MYYKNLLKKLKSPLIYIYGSIQVKCFFFYVTSHVGAYNCMILAYGS